MSKKPTYENIIKGDLDFFVSHKEDDFEGNTIKWDEVIIHGTPEGLKSFAELLIQMADLNQENPDEQVLPTGEREHCHLSPEIELSKSSVPIIVGRLDTKGSKTFYERFIPKDELTEK
jgi:hypothetical protein